MSDGHVKTADEVLHDPTVVHNERIGLVLFFLYLAFYGGFVALVAFAPEVMKSAIAGVNLAIVYGVALIVAAIVLAVLYIFLCKTPPEEPDPSI